MGPPVLRIWRLLAIPLRIIGPALGATCALIAPGPVSAQDTEAAFRDHPFLLFDEADSRTADVSLGDLDGDGDLDVATANGRHWPQQDWLFLNAGNGRLLEAVPLGEVRSTSYTIRLGDLDADGDLDAVVVRDTLPALVYFNDGKARFTLHSAVPDSAIPSRSASLLDLDGDGVLDLVVAARRGVDPVHYGLGGGAFAQPVGLPDEGFGSTGLAPADLDGDGDTDLVLARRDGAASVVCVNQGGRAFQPRPLAGSKGDHRKAVTDDFDGDGRPDIVLVSTKGPHKLYLQKSDGSFGSPRLFGEGGAGIQSIAAADLHGDGDIDLVAGVDGANLVLRNAGDGRFAAEELPGDPADTYGVAVGDMNGDGLPDIVFANSDAPNAILLGVAPAGD